jgi:hypothetical protein
MARISLYGVLSRRSMHARNLAPAQTLHWSRWYGLQLWFTIRDHQLAKEPLCAFCLKAGQVTPATVADHIEPHGGDWNKFRTSALLYYRVCAVHATRRSTAASAPPLA